MGGLGGCSWAPAGSAAGGAVAQAGAKTVVQAQHSTKSHEIGALEGTMPQDYHGSPSALGTR